MNKILVIKKTGLKENFNPDKIHSAVLKSADRIMLKLGKDDLFKISSNVLNKLNLDNITEIKVSDLHNLVESSLDKLGFNDVARSYRDYRNYKQCFIKMMNNVDKKINTLRYMSDKSNANSDSSLVSTKRSLIYQELSSELYKNSFLNSEELQAMTEGFIYIHDRGSRLDTINCCLADIGSIMKGGFSLGPIDYTEPKTVRSAIAVMSDCISVMAGNQYGGISVMVDDILAPYAEKSYNMYMKMYKEMVNSCGGKYDEIKSDEWSFNEVRNDIAQGIQGIEHTYNSVSSSRGDFPFTSFAFGVNKTRFGKLVSEVVLEVRKEGQGKPGKKLPVMFPKLIFLYDENLHGPKKELEDLFMKAIDCSSKCMYPDYLSLTGEGYVPSMYKKYGHDGIVFPMG